MVLGCEGDLDVEILNNLTFKARFLARVLQTQLFLFWGLSNGLFVFKCPRLVHHLWCAGTFVTLIKFLIDLLSFAVNKS